MFLEKVIQSREQGSRMVMLQTEQDPKQVIWTKMLEIGLGQGYKPSVTQVLKKSSSLCDVFMFENHENFKIDLHLGLLSVKYIVVPR
jgi:hypothetical protein